MLILDAADTSPSRPADGRAAEPSRGEDEILFID